MAKKLPLLLIIVSCSLCAGFVASKTTYLATISNFTDIISGDISGTNYSFAVIEATFLDPKTVFLRNKISGNQFQLFANDLTTYTLLQYRGSSYIIIKRPTSRTEIDLGLLRAGYFVWNITGDKPFFVNSMMSWMSCDDPKLLDNHLEFRTMERCNLGEIWYTPSIIELH